MKIEKQYHFRMARLDLLKKSTARRYVDIYKKQDCLYDLFSLSNNGKIDHNYIDTFLKDIKDQIIKEIEKR